jgi:pimeloyl-ACP methyl ester carboxylesterase
MTITVDASENIALDVRGLRMSAKTWGYQGDFPVLAIHGWLDNAASFDRLAPHLDGLYLVAPDLAGHGLSSHRPMNSTYYLWEYALDLQAFITQLRWSEFSIIAHSLGSGIASVLNSINRNIKSMTFIDGMGAPFSINQYKTVEHFQRAYRLLAMSQDSRNTPFKNMIKTVFLTYEEAAIERTKSSIGGISLESARCLVSRGLKDEGGGYVWRHDPRLVYPEYILFTDQQAAAFNSEISCPLYIMLGNSGLFSESYQEKSEHLPGNSQVNWYEGGHHFHLDMPNENFIEDIEHAIHGKSPINTSLENSRLQTEQ